MALINSFEKSGNFLFKHRGEIPVILFIIAIPVIYFTERHFPFLPSMSNTTKIIITVLSIFTSFTGFIIRAIAIATTPKGTSGRNTKKGQIAESLNTTGIYSIVRHPLYLGNYLMWLGIVIYTFNPAFVIIVSLFFWIYYERIMFAEERFLERKFGDEYMEWANKTPAFIPSFKNYTKNVIPFSLKSILRREYSGVLANVIGFVFVDDLRRFFGEGVFEWKTSWHYTLLITIVIVFILRSLKHYTNILSEEGRS